MTLQAIDTGHRVLGTRVFDLDGAERATVVLSDLHVPASGGPVVTWLRDLLRAAAAAGSRVFVLGDLFDSYVTPAQLRVGVWRDTAALFAEATRAGARIAVLHGNRDFLLGEEWQRATGAVVVPGGIRTPLAGQRTLLLHGDELCQNDLPYQRAKKWLRRPWVKAIARRLPLRLALSVAARARRRSQRVIQGGDQGRFLPTAAAVAAALAPGMGVDVLVFGHIHRLARGRLAAGEYIVLPAFDRAGVHLAGDAGRLRFASVADPAMAEPEPAPLPLG